MAMLQADTGYIIYQCLMHFDDEPFKIFRIKMTVEDRKEQLEKVGT